MVGQTLLMRATTLLLGCALLAGCANFTSFWHQTSAAPQPAEPLPTPSLLPEKSTDGSKPRPAPALLINDAPANPQPAEAAPETPITQLPDAPVLPLPMAQNVGQPPPAKEAPKPAAAELPAQPLQGAASAAALREIARRAAQRFNDLDGYMMRLKRREMVHGKMSPDEIMLCVFRKQPWSVYMKWLSEEGKNREVLYVKGQYKDEIQTLTAAGDIFFLPAGRRFNVAVDSPFVKAKSRHPITEAGLGPVIGRFKRMADLAEKGDTSEGAATYMGKAKRPEYPYDLIVVHQVLAPRNDPGLPRGGQRWWFFDPTNDMPVLLLAHDDAGREVEYYCHDRFFLQYRPTDDDFNPDKLWPQSR